MTLRCAAIVTPIRAAVGKFGGVLCDRPLVVARGRAADRGSWLPA